ncbi:MAG: TMEM175 family protein, partial [Fibrobacteria bacterium]
HHHLLHAVKHVSGGILWANLHLLFWLSLIPFVTSWMGENHFAALPVALYGVVQFFCGAAYTILTRALIRHHGKDSLLAKAIGENLAGDVKGLISVFLYAVAIAASYWNTAVSAACFVFVAVMWLIPDRRIEKVLPNKKE